MKNTSIISLILIGAIFSIACSSNQSTKVETTTPDATTTTTISGNLSALNLSADSAWAEIVRLDSQKFADIKRLVQEISYCKKYDEKAVSNALAYTEAVYSIRYSQLSLSDSIIDLYDAKSTDLINKVRNIKSNTAEISQHPLADQLENEILEADAQLVNYRNRYDQLAMAFNSLLAANKEAINNDPTLSKYQTKKIFSVPL